MPTIVTDAPYATFINTFRCLPDDQDAVVQINIDIVEQVAAQYDEFISATVHRSTDGTRVVNYLQWRTPGDLHAMQASPEFRLIAQRFAGLIEFDPHEVTIAHGRRGGPPYAIEGVTAVPAVPIAVQEIVLGARLLVRGFRNQGEGVVRM
jgi:Antibiotic biosynthesis monooxygenase